MVLTASIFEDLYRKAWQKKSILFIVWCYTTYTHKHTYIHEQFSANSARERERERRVLCLKWINAMCFGTSYHSNTTECVAKRVKWEFVKTAETEERSVLPNFVGSRFMRFYCCHEWGLDKTVIGHKRRSNENTKGGILVKGLWLHYCLWDSHLIFAMIWLHGFMMRWCVS